MKKFIFALLLTGIGFAFSLFCFIYAACNPWTYNGIDGLLGEAVKVRIKCAPVDGKANKELIETLADAFDVAKSAVVFKGGETSKTKRLLVKGVTVAQVKAVVEG